jgi:Zn-dependent M32 family carboxypeptidase
MQYALRQPSFGEVEMAKKKEEKMEEEVQEEKVEEGKAEDKKSNEIVQEFRRLGDNLRETIEAAWESDQRKKLSTDIKEGLRQLSDSIEKAATDIGEKPQVQKLRDDVDDLAARVRSGEVGDKARTGLKSALDKINTELEKTSSSLRGVKEEGETEEPAEESKSEE